MYCVSVRGVMCEGERVYCVRVREDVLCGGERVYCVRVRMYCIV